MPENTVYVGRGTKWGNPYKVGETQIRMPALDGSEWEHERRLYKTSGEKHAYVHNSDGSHITWHQVEDATAEQCVELYREWISFTAPQEMQTLAGKDLACWCPPDQPCHADVLLELANS
jgi:hypothetical protein